MKLSEATLQWEHWRARRRRRRQLKAWGGTVALALIVLALAAWGGFPRIFNVGEKGEAIAVKLGNPEGEDLPLKVSAVPDQVMQAVMSAQRQSALTTVEETRASVLPIPTPAKPAPAVKPQPTPTPAVREPAPPTVTEKVIRGSEKGSSHELVLKPQGEKISQNIAPPPYQYMPLPTRLDAALLARVKAKPDLNMSADDRRDVLLQYYTKGAELTLKSNPPIELRPLWWEILDEAGYDLVNAEYKKGALRPVIITFRIGVPEGSAGNPKLLDVTLEQSSGAPAVDEAVLYAFKASGFANGTGQVAQGRYTYDFTSGR